MKKMLFLSVFLSVLFIACSSNDENDEGLSKHGLPRKIESATCEYNLSYDESNRLISIQNLEKATSVLTATSVSYNGNGSIAVTTNDGKGKTIVNTYTVKSPIMMQVCTKVVGENDSVFAPHYFEFSEYGIETVGNFTYTYDKNGNLLNWINANNSLDIDMYVMQYDGHSGAFSKVKSPRWFMQTITSLLPVDCALFFVNNAKTKSYVNMAPGKVPCVFEYTYTYNNEGTPATLIRACETNGISDFFTFTYY